MEKHFKTEIMVRDNLIDHQEEVIQKQERTITVLSTMLAVLSIIMIIYVAVGI